jgi:signal transduction histidine kinase/phage shock protein PspC (stress-responsive transcriptional regulator)
VTTADDPADVQAAASPASAVEGATSTPAVPAPAAAPVAVPVAVAVPSWRTRPRPPLERRRQGRVVAGVAAGLAAHLGIPVVPVRIALVVTSIPFGAGLAVYVFLWATMRQGRDDLPPVAVTGPATGLVPPASAPAPAAPGSPAAPVAGPTPAPTPPPPTEVPGGGQAGSAPAAATVGSTAPAGSPSAFPLDLASLRTWLRSGNQAVVIAVLGVAALAVAGALWLGSAGFDVHAEVVLPVVAIGIGAIFFWSQLDETDVLGARRPVRWIWLVIGLTLTVLGLVALLARGTNLAELWQVAGAVLAALVGVAVLSAPWVLRLWSNLRLEQAARIRATERADIAAHLHDSVLQTLALIQRQAGDSATVARLARAQERQLRSYLYDEDARAGSLGAALTAALGEVEDLHGVPVELVVTGDRPMDEHLEALVKAVREAAWNAVRHAEPPVSAYVEVGPAAVEAFVRDHGVGFELDDVPDDRAGVRESIIGRMERHGGSARIRRRADGTEIELRLPVTTPATTPVTTPVTTPAATPATTPAPASAPPATPDPEPSPKTQEQHP